MSVATRVASRASAGPGAGDAPRAASDGRPPDSWEHAMPYGIRLDERRSLAGRS